MCENPRAPAPVICHVDRRRYKEMAMMDANGEIIPLAPSEMGNSGAAARWLQGKSRTITPPRVYAHRTAKGDRV